MRAHLTCGGDVTTNTPGTADAQPSPRYVAVRNPNDTACVGSTTPPQEEAP